MYALIQSTLALLLGILNSTSLSTSVIDTWLAYLVNLLPTIKNEFNDLVPQFEAIIEGLKGQDQATPDQITALGTMITGADQDYQAAYAAYLANHQAV